MHMKKRLITLLELLALLLADVDAQVTFNYQDRMCPFLRWGCITISENEVEILSADAKIGNVLNRINVRGDVTIPSSIYYEGINYKVTSLRNTFKGAEYLESVVIPNTVKSIGKETFNGCKYLQNIIIPSSVTKIGYAAFASSGLRDIKIPNTVVSIEDYAFQNCQFPKVTIPNSVTYMGKSVFGLNKVLKDVIIPNSVTEIPEDAFCFCESLENISIPNSIRSIGKAAFQGCESLRKIEVPMSVTSIGQKAFEYCKMLAEVEGLHSAMDIDVSAFNGIPFNFTEIKESFDFNARGFVITKLKEWQKKRDFETTAQYQARVTKENQQRKTQELMKEAIKNYTTEHPLSVTLGSYDADYEMYALNSNYGQKYMKIPLAQAPSLKNDFSKATFSATYLATEEGLKIDELTMTFNGKTYKAEKTATEVAVATIDIDLPEIKIPLVNKSQQTVAQQRQSQQNMEQQPVQVMDRSIDQNIPLGGAGNNKTFAVIIGNEQYTQVEQVPFAVNDAKVFAEYCQKTLGLPANNVRQYQNATYGTLLTAISDIKSIVKAYNGNVKVIFYYAGHGIPNEMTHDAFLLPVDANGRQTEACYPVSRLYKELGEMGANSVVVFMDACFSGAQRGDGMLASARSVAIKPKSSAPQGNMVVFSAASEDETAFPYKEKGHGLFTYFLLKKLQESKGDCTLGELGDFIQTNVSQQSVVVNRKSQTPTITPSPSLIETWKTIKLNELR